MRHLPALSRSRARVLQALLILCGLPVVALADDEFALKNSVIVVRATAEETPPRITLEWPRTAVSGGFTIYRKAVEADSWAAPLATLTDAQATRFVDETAVPGTCYEYMLETIADLPAPRQQTAKARGFLASGIALPAIDARGTVILLVDDTMAAPLAGELERLEQDLIGDGWSVVRHEVPRQATVCNSATAAEVEAIKKIILGDYDADRDSVKAVLLLGRIPLPYAGWLIPDGHGHEAREADTYYALPDETWTDWRSYGSEGPRSNVAGDGRFDQSAFKTVNVKLAVGRVDMSGMPGFGVSETELLRRYLNKHHAFRHRHTAFPDSGDSAGAGLVGSKTAFHLESLFSRSMANAVGGQIFGEILAPRLWCYAEDLAYDNNNLGLFYSSYAPQYVFTGCWGSGTINYDVVADKRGMGRPYLATSGACLTWVCGQPNRYFHWMAMGESIGGCERLAMRNGSLYPSGANGNMFFAIFRGLLGDPTLRLHTLAPPAGLTITDATLSWEPSADRDLEGFRGYHVYRAADRSGPFTRLTSDPVSGTSWTDPQPPAEAVYQVRAIRLETSSTGSYHNNSQGAFVSRGAIGIVPSTRWVVIPEAGTATFRVKLSTKPPAAVKVSVARSQGDETIGVTSDTPLTFTPDTWNEWQPVTLSAAHDADAIDGQAAITLSAPGLSSLTVSAVTTDTAIVVSQEMLRLPESTTGSVQVRLAGPPAADITVTATRGHVYATGENISIQSGETLTFTPANWDRWQTMTLVYADGDEIPPPQNLSAIFANYTLTAPGIRGAQFRVSGIERHAHLTATAAPADSGTASPSAAATVVYGVPTRIKAEPAPGHRFAGWKPASHDSGVVIADPASPETTATAYRWSYALMAGVVAQFVPDGEAAAAPLITTERDTPLVTIPEGKTAAFKVRLTKQPAADVKVRAVGERTWDADIAIQTDTPLTFTPANWNEWQSVTLSAKADDDLAAGVALVSLQGDGLLTSHVYAVEEEPEVVLTAFPEVGGLAVTPGGRTTVRRGVPVAITAQPAPGHRFDQWVTVEGTPAIADPRAAVTTVTTDAPASIRAVFTRVGTAP